MKKLLLATLIASSFSATAVMADEVEAPTWTGSEGSHYVNLVSSEGVAYKINKTNGKVFSVVDGAKGELVGNMQANNGAWDVVVGEGEEAVHHAITKGDVNEDGSFAVVAPKFADDEEADFQPSEPDAPEEGEESEQDVGRPSPDMDEDFTDNLLPGGPGGETPHAGDDLPAEDPSIPSQPNLPLENGNELGDNNEPTSPNQLPLENGNELGGNNQQVHENTDKIAQNSTSIDELYETTAVNADGIAANKAAIGQNRQDIDKLFGEVDRLDDRIDGTQASLHAVTNARPFLSGEGKTAIGVGLGNAGSVSAVAVGAAHAITAQWSVSATANVTTGGDDSDFSFGAGTQYEF